MQFVVQGLDNASFNSSFNAKIEHENKILLWNLASLGKTVIKTDKLFVELNEYLKKFSMDENESIFQLYSSIQNSLFASMSYDMIHKEVRRYTAALLNYFNFESVKDFVRSNYNIPIPTNFIASFQEDVVKNITRDKTYTREDYVELIAIVIVFKALLPVFAEYIGVIKTEVGKEYKELYVLSIIDDSQYKDHRVIQKLGDYIRGHLKSNFDDKVITMRGINDEEFIDLTVAKTIIRKLIIGDLSDSDPNHNLITYTYKFITQTKKENEKGSSNRIHIKDPNTSGDGETNLSTLEQFKLKQDVAIGDIVPLEYYLHDPMSIIKRLMPSMDKSLLKEFQEYSKQLEKEIILDPQVTVLRIMYKNIVSPKSILYLPKNIIINFIAIGSTYLWQNDLKFLALLMGSVTRVSDIQIISNTGSKGRISPEIVDELNELFPYGMIRRESGNKFKTTNVAIESVDRLTNKFVDHVWYSTANYERIREAMGDSTLNDNKLIIPHRIRDEIGKFVILASRGASHV